MTTPAEIRGDIIRFCNELSPGASPEFVGFDGSVAGVQDNCFSNVSRLVEALGGEALLGWTIWEWPGILLEAEFHAVWEDSNGRLIDPTPKADGETRVLFLSDPNAVDDGGITPSRHFPLVDWQEVAEYIDVCRNHGEEQRNLYMQFRGIPVDRVNEFVFEKAESAAQITRRLNQSQLTSGITILQPQAQIRFSTSAGDVEASAALARYQAASGDFRSAFETLIATAAIRNLAREILPDFLQIVDACQDQRLLNDVRRQFSMWLNP
jgi:hypothetical protein